MMQSFINNKKRIYTSVLLVTFRNSDYDKLARLTPNILVLNIATLLVLSETQALPIPLQAFRTDSPWWSHIFLHIHSKHGLIFCSLTWCQDHSYLFPIPDFSSQSLFSGTGTSGTSISFFFFSPFFPSSSFSSTSPYNCLPLILFSLLTPQYFSPALLHLHRWLSSPSHHHILPCLHSFERVVCFLFPGSQIFPSHSSRHYNQHHLLVKNLNTSALCVLTFLLAYFQSPELVSWHQSFRTATVLAGLSPSARLRSTVKMFLCASSQAESSSLCIPRLHFLKLALHTTAPPRLHIQEWGSPNSVPGYGTPGYDSYIFPWSSFCRALCSKVLYTTEAVD